MTLLKPLTKRQQRSLETKQRIYDVAMNLISLYGFENVTISDICTHADVTVGTFYHFYSSKEEILLAYAESEDFMFTSFSNDSPNESHSLRLKNIFIKKVQMITVEKTPDLVRYCRIAHLKTLNYSGYSPDRKFIQLLFQEITAGQNSGEFNKDINANQFIETCLFLSDGLNSAWTLSDGTIDIIEKANQQIDLLLNILTSR